jgi:hypothetical protein
VVQGNPDTPAEINGFHFQPVIRGENLSIAGQVKGRVTDNSAADLGGVLVSIDLDSDPDATTHTETDGTYTLTGIPQGTYTVTASKPGYVTESDIDVEVVAGSATEVNFFLTPIP